MALRIVPGVDVSPIVRYEIVQKSTGMVIAIGSVQMSQLIGWLANWETSPYVFLRAIESGKIIGYTH